MRSAEGTASGRLPMLLLAAAVLGLEAAGLCAVVVANVVDLAAGNTYQPSNAIALIILEVIVAVGVAWIGLGVARARPWSRTPAVMIQVIAAIIGSWLLEAHQYAGGIPALLLAVAGLAGLFAPASLRALSRSANTR